jgi:peptidyl-prolyl cis-trans isomerase D
MSDDLGSVDKGGDYGWFDENKGFVDPFKNAGLQGTVGNITVVPTQFGFHIIEVLNVSKTRHNAYTVAQITKLIAPSGETSQEYYKIASDFAGKNQTADAFNKSVETEKLNKRIAENIKEGEKALPGLEGAKDLVRWVYKSKKGDISPVFEFKDRFVVALLVGIKDKGIAPLEDVKDDVTVKAIRDKKAETFIAEYTAKAGASKSIDDIASKMGLTTEKADNLTFSAYNVAAIGREDALIGTATSMKAGAVSKAIKGDNGVFVVNTISATEAVLPKDFKGKQKEIEQMNTGRVDYELFDALKEKAGIEDHRGKFDF